MMATADTRNSQPSSTNPGGTAAATSTPSPLPKYYIIESPLYNPPLRRVERCLEEMEGLPNSSNTIPQGEAMTTPLRRTSVGSIGSGSGQRENSASSSEKTSTNSSPVQGKSQPLPGVTAAAVERSSRSADPSTTRLNRIVDSQGFAAEETVTLYRKNQVVIALDFSASAFEMLPSGEMCIDRYGGAVSDIVESLIDLVKQQSLASMPFCRGEEHQQESPTTPLAAPPSPLTPTGSQQGTSPTTPSTPSTFADALRNELSSARNAQASSSTAQWLPSIKLRCYAVNGPVLDSSGGSNSGGGSGRSGRGYGSGRASSVNLQDMVLLAQGEELLAVDDGAQNTLGCVSDTIIPLAPPFEITAQSDLALCVGRIRYSIRRHEIHCRKLLRHQDAVWKMCSLGETAELLGNIFPYSGHQFTTSVFVSNFTSVQGLDAALLSRMLLTARDINMGLYAVDSPQWDSPRLRGVSLTIRRGGGFLFEQATPVAQLAPTILARTYPDVMLGTPHRLPSQFPCPCEPVLSALVPTESKLHCVLSVVDPLVPLLSVAAARHAQGWRVWIDREANKIVARKAFQLHRGTIILHYEAATTTTGTSSLPGDGEDGVENSAEKYQTVLFVPALLCIASKPLIAQFLSTKATKFRSEQHGRKYVSQQGGSSGPLRPVAAGVGGFSGSVGLLGEEDSSDSCDAQGNRARPSAEARDDTLLKAIKSSARWSVTTDAQLLKLHSLPYATHMLMKAKKEEGATEGSSSDKPGTSPTSRHTTTTGISLSTSESMLLDVRRTLDLHSTTAGTSLDLCVRATVDSRCYSFKHLRPMKTFKSVAPQPHMSTTPHAAIHSCARAMLGSKLRVIIHTALEGTGKFIPIPEPAQRPPARMSSKASQHVRCWSFAYLGDIGPTRHGTAILQCYSDSVSESSSCLATVVECRLIFVSCNDVALQRKVWDFVDRAFSKFRRSEKEKERKAQKEERSDMNIIAVRRVDTLFPAAVARYHNTILRSEVPFHYAFLSSGNRSLMYSTLHPLDKLKDFRVVERSFPLSGTGFSDPVVWYEMTEALFRWRMKVFIYGSAETMTMAHTSRPSGAACRAELLHCSVGDGKFFFTWRWRKVASVASWDEMLATTEARDSERPGHFFNIDREEAVEVLFCYDRATIQHALMCYQPSGKTELGLRGGSETRYWVPVIRRMYQEDSRVIAAYTTFGQARNEIHAQHRLDRGLTRLPLEALFPNLDGSYNRPAAMTLPCIGPRHLSALASRLAYFAGAASTISSSTIAINRLPPVLAEQLIGYQTAVIGCCPFPSASDDGGSDGESWGEQGEGFFCIIVPGERNTSREELFDEDEGIAFAGHTSAAPSTAGRSPLLPRSSATASTLPESSDGRSPQQTALARQSGENMITVFFVSVSLNSLSQALWEQPSAGGSENYRCMSCGGGGGTEFAWASAPQERAYAPFSQCLADFHRLSCVVEFQKALSHSPTRHLCADSLLHPACHQRGLVPSTLTDSFVELHEEDKMYHHKFNVSHIIRCLALTTSFQELSLEEQADAIRDVCFPFKSLCSVPGSDCFYLLDPEVSHPSSTGNGNGDGPRRTSVVRATPSGAREMGTLVLNAGGEDDLEFPEAQGGARQDAEANASLGASGREPPLEYLHRRADSTADSQHSGSMGVGHGNIELELPPFCSTEFPLLVALRLRVIHMPQDSSLVPRKYSVTFPSVNTENFLAFIRRLNGMAMKCEAHTLHLEAEVLARSVPLKYIELLRGCLRPPRFKVLDFCAEEHGHFPVEPTGPSFHFQVQQSPTSGRRHSASSSPILRRPAEDVVEEQQRHPPDEDGVLPVVDYDQGRVGWGIVFPLLAEVVDHLYEDDVDAIKMDDLRLLPNAPVAEMSWFCSELLREAAIFSLIQSFDSGSYAELKAAVHEQSSPTQLRLQASPAGEGESSVEGQLSSSSPCAEPAATRAGRDASGRSSSKSNFSHRAPMQVVKTTFQQFLTSIVFPALRDCAPEPIDWNLREPIEPPPVVARCCTSTECSVSPICRAHYSVVFGILERRLNASMTEQYFEEALASERLPLLKLSAQEFLFVPDEERFYRQWYCVSLQEEGGQVLVRFLCFVHPDDVEDAVAATPQPSSGASPAFCRRLPFWDVTEKLKNAMVRVAEHVFQRQLLNELGKSREVDSDLMAEHWGQQQQAVVFSKQDLMSSQAMFACKGSCAWSARIPPRLAPQTLLYKLQAEFSVLGIRNRPGCYIHYATQQQSSSVSTAAPEERPLRDVVGYFRVVFIPSSRLTPDGELDDPSLNDPNSVPPLFSEEEMRSRGGMVCLHVYSTATPIEPLTPVVERVKDWFTQISVADFLTRACDAEEHWRTKLQVSREDQELLGLSDGCSELSRVRERVVFKNANPVVPQVILQHFQTMRFLSLNIEAPLSGSSITSSGKGTDDPSHSRLPSADLGTASATGGASPSRVHSARALSKHASSDSLSSVSTTTTGTNVDSAVVRRVLLEYPSQQQRSRSAMAFAAVETADGGESPTTAASTPLPSEPLVLCCVEMTFAWSPNETNDLVLEMAMSCTPLPSSSSLHTIDSPSASGGRKKKDRATGSASTGTPGKTKKPDQRRVQRLEAFGATLRALLADADIAISFADHLGKKYPLTGARALFSKEWHLARRIQRNSFLLKSQRLELKREITQHRLVDLAEELVKELRQATPTFVSCGTEAIAWSKFQWRDKEVFQQEPVVENCDLFIFCGLSFEDANGDVPPTTVFGPNRSGSLGMRPLDIKTRYFDLLPAGVLIRVHINCIDVICYNVKDALNIWAITQAHAAAFAEDTALIRETALQQLGFMVPTATTEETFAKKCCGDTSNVEKGTTVDCHQLVFRRSVEHHRFCSKTAYSDPFQTFATGLIDRGYLINHCFRENEALYVLHHETKLAARVETLLDFVEEGKLYRFSSTGSPVGGSTSDTVQYKLTESEARKYPHTAMIPDHVARHRTRIHIMLEERNGYTRERIALQNVRDCLVQACEESKLVGAVVELQAFSRLYYYSRVPDFNLRNARQAAFPEQYLGFRRPRRSPNGADFEKVINSILHDYSSSLTRGQPAVVCASIRPPVDEKASTGYQKLDERLACRFGQVFVRHPHTGEEQQTFFAPDLIYCVLPIRHPDHPDSLEDCGLIIIEIGFELVNYALDVYVVQGSVPATIISTEVSLLKLQLAFSSRLYDLAVARLLRTVREKSTVATGGKEFSTISAANLLRYYPIPPRSSLNCIRRLSLPYHPASNAGSGTSSPSSDTHPTTGEREDRGGGGGGGGGGDDLDDGGDTVVSFINPKGNEHYLDELYECAGLVATDRTQGTCSMYIMAVRVGKDYTGGVIGPAASPPAVRTPSVIGTQHYQQHQQQQPGQGQGSFSAGNSPSKQPPTPSVGYSSSPSNVGTGLFHWVKLELFSRLKKQYDDESAMASASVTWQLVRKKGATATTASLVESPPPGAAPPPLVFVRVNRMAPHTLERFYSTINCLPVRSFLALERAGVDWAHTLRHRILAGTSGFTVTVVENTAKKHIDVFVFKDGEENSVGFATADCQTTKLLGVWLGRKNYQQTVKQLAGPPTVSERDILELLNRLLLQALWGATEAPLPSDSRP